MIVSSSITLPPVLKFLLGLLLFSTVTNFVIGISLLFLGMKQRSDLQAFKIIFNSQILNLFPQAMFALNHLVGLTRIDKGSTYGKGNNKAEKKN